MTRKMQFSGGITVNPKPSISEESENVCSISLNSNAPQKLQFGSLFQRKTKAKIKRIFCQILKSSWNHFKPRKRFFITFTFILTLFYINFPYIFLSFWLHFWVYFSSISAPGGTPGTPKSKILGGWQNVPKMHQFWDAPESRFSIKNTSKNQ